MKEECATDGCKNNPRGGTYCPACEKKRAKAKPRKKLNPYDGVGGHGPDGFKKRGSK